MRTAKTLANTGTGTISAGTVNEPPPPNVNLQQTVSITFNNPPTTFNVNGVGTGNPVNVPFTAGQNIQYNGWTIQISGAPAAGDMFTVEANAAGVADNRNALLLAAPRPPAPWPAAPPGISRPYSQIVSEVGNKTRQVETIGQAQTNLVTGHGGARADVRRQSRRGGRQLAALSAGLPGVGQVIQVANSLFDDLLAVFG